ARGPIPSDTKTHHPRTVRGLHEAPVAGSRPSRSSSHLPDWPVPLGSGRRLATSQVFRTSEWTSASKSSALLPVRWRLGRQILKGEAIKGWLSTALLQVRSGRRLDSSAHRFRTAIATSARRRPRNRPPPLPGRGRPGAPSVRSSQVLRPNTFKPDVRPSQEEIPCAPSRSKSLEPRDRSASYQI